MKVYNPHNGRDLSNDNLYGIAGGTKSARMQAATGEYSLDISSKDKDINAFGMENLMSVSDVMNKAAAKDVSIEQDALVVMSNSMSGEDFAKLQKDGFSPADMDIEETVTSLDKIKAKLVQSGVVIPGYTDDLSASQLEAITGSTVAANAIENALRENQLPVSKENAKAINEVIDLSTKVDAPSDDAKKYMVGNSLKPSVNNFYMAEHSSSEKNAGRRAGYYIDETGYVGKNPTDVDMSELKPQIEKIITESGLEVNEDTMKDAQWLITKNIPVTKENLEGIRDINSVTFPISAEVVAKSSAAAIADGYEAKDASLTNLESMVTKAGHMIDMVEDALKGVAGDKSHEVSNATDDTKTFDPLKKMRLVEEIRLHLTLEANLQLLKKGISIDTTDLEKTVNDLKQAEKEAYAPFLMNDKNIKAEDIAKYDGNLPENIKKYDEELTLKIDLFKQTTEAIRGIKTAPSEVVAGLTEDTKVIDFARKASALKSDYDKAGKSYETMMTAPRYDMGDSIKKAFRNVDDILEDLNLEVTRLNEKAVRILGYAGMDINESNIDSALKAEIAVENIVSHMTPARTLKMIRDGENPLEKDVYELSNELMSEDIDEANEKYSEFLVRLEKSGDITESEKKSFIGIYRLFRKIEKSDGKLLGNVINAGEKLTFENLISASRSNRQLGTDIKVDDSFGAVEKLITGGESITDQILAAFRNDSEANKEYSKAQAKEVREAVKVEEDVLKVLDNVSEPHSPINMTAVNMLMSQRGSLFKTLKKSISDNSNENDDFEGEFSKLRDSFTSEESVKKAYEDFADKASNAIKKSVINADKYVDVRSLKLAGKQLNIISKMAGERTYEVPVEIGGELTSINLKLINDSENAGKVTATFNTELTGKVSAEFTLRNGEVSGFVVTENSYFEGVVKEKDEAFRGEFEASGVKVSSIYHTSSRGLSISGNYLEKAGVTTADNRQLYAVAKAIIRAVNA